MKTVRNIPYTAAKLAKQTLDLFLPDTGPYPLFLYFHGGGIESGDKADPFPQPEKFIKNGVAYASVNYRLYPTAHYPEFLEDAAAAVHWLAKNMGTCGPVSGLYLGGSSAGAYIAMMLCFAPRYLWQYGLDRDFFSGFVFDAGQSTVHFNVLKERGLDPRRIVVDEAAPLYHICANLPHGSMCFFEAEEDIPVRREQTQLLLAALKDFGYPPQKIHSHHMAGYTHCAYDETVFAEIVCEFIHAVESDGCKK